MPVLDYFEAGRDSQTMFKLVWQRAIQRRNINENDRPVFLWADEFQHFIHPHDAISQTTSRSSRIAVVYLTQNLANLYANMGGNKSEHHVKSLLGTMGSKLFHCNADSETNNYASALIGEGYMRDRSTSSNFSNGVSVGQNDSYRLEKIVRPEHFSQLKCGGPENDYLVEAYIHRQGKS